MKLSQITPQNIKGYIQGNLRKFMEGIDENFVPEYIMEQIHWRISIMDIKCLENKECPCTCKVPQKQYEDRPCENNCYPPMMSLTDWEKFKQVSNITKESIEEGLYKRKELYDSI